MLLPVVLLRLPDKGIRVVVSRETIFKNKTSCTGKVQMRPVFSLLHALP